MSYFIPDPSHTRCTCIASLTANYERSSIFKIITCKLKHWLMLILYENDRGLYLWCVCLLTLYSTHGSALIYVHMHITTYTLVCKSSHCYSREMLELQYE